MRTSHLLGIAFAAIGITAAVLALQPWAGMVTMSQSDSSLSEVERADKAALRSARPVIPSADADDTAAIDQTIAGFREVLVTRLADFPPGILRLDQRDRDQILEVACERVRILLTADYEVYADHVRRLNRLTPESAELERRLIPQETWNKYASAYRHCAIDTSRAEVVPAYAGGEIARLHAGGMTTFEPKVHPFVDRGPIDTTLDSNADAVDVRVPIGSTDARTNAPITVFLVIRLARASPGAPWLPWQLGVNDPTDSHPLVPPPF